MPMPSLNSKRALVVGVANESSIAWGVARQLREAGARLAITYLNEKAEPHVRPLAKSLGASLILPLDVTRADQIDALYQQMSKDWGRLDILVHSIAFAPRADLQGPVVDSSSTGFAQAMDVSVHSFVRLVRRFRPLMTEGGSCLTMSYYGAERIVPSYNLMGPVKAALEAVVRELAAELGERNINVNALSPGPMPTRAASGIRDFDRLLEHAAKSAPMRRLPTIDEVGVAAVFLTSDSARMITGTVLHVDGGCHIMA